MTSSLAMSPVAKLGNDPSSSIDSASRAATQPPSRSKTRVCYYFQNKGKCRDGDNCRFIHERPSNPASRPGVSSTSNIEPDENGMIPDRKQAVTEPLSLRVVPKPVPQAQTQDPREFQLGQLRRRFSPKESRQAASEFLAVEEGTCLQFKLSPSDPDFPFDLAALECSLSVPLKYPASRPTLRVQNQDIPRGFAVNVENGFNNLAKEKQDATLLELVKLLDKNLEVFLSAQKAETVKIVVPTKDTRHLSTPATRIANAGPVGVGAEKSIAKNTVNRAEASSTTPKYQNPELRYTPEQKLDASKRREVETRQLEARMGRLPLFKKSSDGISYTIPIEPRKQAELPVSLRAVKAIQLFVPLLYPLQGCRVQLEGVDASEAKPVQQGFEKKAASQKEVTLMGHVNYLAQNMHILAKTEPEAPKAPAQAVVAKPSPIPAVPESKGTEPEAHQDPERSHIQYITRPLEWTTVEHSDGESDSEDDYSYDSGDETYSDDDHGAELKLKSAHGHDHGNEHGPSQDPTSTSERGTAISFPFIELYGIELLEVVTLNITVKCERCKDTMEITGLKNGIQKKESCKKCASPFLVGFRRDLVHSHAVRAGFLDLDGCIIGDMLPSTFIPTCSQCSTAYPLPGITTVRGEATSNVCRECHQKFTFKIPEVRFLRISSTHQLQTTSGPRRKKDTLGLVPGTELPKRGRCRHYAKSYRWFRFSCCQKVYACDKCHDDSEEHPNEWANRMICGHCSREGNYRPEDCGFCHQFLIGKKGGGGFWEGGTGTRDPVKMSRKDPRKYRNRKAKK